VKTLPLRILILGALAAGVSACGGGAPFQPGKEAAAHAVYDSSQAADGSGGGHYAQGAGISLSVSLDCAKKGTATLKDLRVALALEEGVAMQTGFNLAFGGCSHDGKTFRDGTLAVTKQLRVDENGMRVRLTLKGRVNYSGEIGDFVDVDVTQELNATLLTATSGNVRVTLDGTVENSTGTYVFDHEELEVTAGFLPILELAGG
jgi:predicted heme/steroid binding protein